MTIDLDAVGRPLTVADVTWTDREVLLYALGVGAGQEDPAGELAFTMECAEGHPLRVLPTFGVALTHHASEEAIRDVDISKVVHAEQALELEGPLPSPGTARVTASVTGIYDKGSGALMVVEGEAVEATTGQPLLRLRSAMFVRGAGGFGGDRGPSSTWSAPDREPDARLSATTRPDQALLYRLSGDRNALHADPVFARGAGFERPILHGLCTYGFTGRLLLHEFCDSDPARLRSIQTRFSAPVMPGERLDVEAWKADGEVLFRTTSSSGNVVLDRGRLVLA
jgi:acyl dehydratase